MNKKYRNHCSYFLLLISISFILIGAYRGESFSVLAKAIRICLECIGIG